MGNERNLTRFKSKKETDFGRQRLEILKPEAYSVRWEWKKQRVLHEREENLFLSGCVEFCGEWSERMLGM